MKKHVIKANVLPGEPLNGSGKICIHLFVPDEKGSFVEPSVSCMEKIKEDENEIDRQTLRQTRGRLACDSKRLVAPRQQGNVTIITPRTDDPRAVSCPKCKASKDYDRIMKIVSAT